MNRMRRDRVFGMALAAAGMAAACSRTGTATESRPADPPAAAGALAPRLASDGDRLALSWVEPDAGGGAAVRFSLWRGGGWSPVQLAARDPRLVKDGADVPGVVPLPDGSLAAHWTVGRGSSEYARDLFVSISRDGGATWSAPASPHRDGTVTEHGLATLVPGLSGAPFGIVWLDGRAGEGTAHGEGGTALYWASWNGGSFDAEVLIDPRVCDCCKTAAAVAAAGPIVAYRDRGDDERRDISLSLHVSGDWSPPVSVREDGWRLTACPTNGPSITARADLVWAAWFSGAGSDPAVRATWSTDGGRTLADAVRVDGGNPSGRVDAAILPDGAAAIVWLERKRDRAEVRVRRARPGGSLSEAIVAGETSASRKSGYPRVAAVGGRDVLVAWVETGEPGRLRASVVTLP